MSDGSESKLGDDDAAESGSAGRWSAALQRLASKDRERYKLAIDQTLKPSAILQDVLAATNAKKKTCLEKRWKLVIGDRTIIIRDVLEKTATWVQKFIEIGTVAVSYDPVSAAIPWAAVKLVMQATVNDVESFCYILESLEKISNIITRCRVVEILYLVEPCDISFKSLSDAVLDIYTMVLSYLCRVLQYYATNTVVRLIKSTVTAKADLAKEVERVEQAEGTLSYQLQLVEATKADNLAHRVETMQRTSGKTHEEVMAAIEQLQETVESLTAPITRIDSRLADIQDNLAADVRLKLLKSISTVTYATHHRVAREGRLSDSGQWLLRKDAYRSWRGTSSSSVLWLHGIPGCGKTKLTSLVIDNVKSDGYLAFFYCTRNPAEPLRSQCRAILASLVRQLATTAASRAIFPAVIEQYQDAIDGFADFDDQAWTVSDCERVILELLKEYPAVTIVIDALDEVLDEDRQDLMNVLAELLKSAETLLKIFVSSRDNLDIALFLSGSPNVYIEADDNYQDIKTFTHKRLTAAKLLRGNVSPELHDEITKTLLHGARGMFRWVELQIDSLKPLKVAADVRSRLGALPESLEASYWEIYEKIMLSGDVAAKIAVFTFRWLLYAQETIPVETFTLITSVALRSDGLGAQEHLTNMEILDVCANLVVARDNTFVFAHLSVREFLEKLHKRGVSTMDASISNGLLAQTCIKHLQTTFDDKTRKSLPGMELSEPDPSIPEPSDPDPGTSYLIVRGGSTVDNSQSSLKSYASRYWVHHVAEAGDQRKSGALATLIQNFCVDTSESRVADSFATWCKVLNKDKLIDGIGWASGYKKIVQVSSEQPPNPMWLACLYSWLELVEFFFRVNFRELSIERKLGDLSTYEIDSPLTYAVSMGRVELAECLARCYSTAPVALRTKQVEHDPLVRAVEQGDLKLVSLMLALEYGGVESQNKAFLAASQRELLEVMQMLIEKTSVLETVGFKALTECCLYELFKSFDYLISKGCRTEPSDKLLYAATWRNNVEFVKFLLKKNMGRQGLSTALRMAVSDGHTEIAAILIDCGAAKDNFAVIREILHECTHSALRLIDAGYDVKGRYLVKGRTALHYAAERGYHQIVAALLEKGVSIDAYDHDRCTPLHLATRNGHAACVQLLLDSGADVLATDRNGDLPLDIAEQHDCHLIEKLLRDNMENLLKQLQSQQLDVEHPTNKTVAQKHPNEASEGEAEAPEIPSISISEV